MDFSPSPRVEELSGRIGAFLDEHVYPVELEALKALDEEVGPGVPYPRILVELRERAKADGLWNLFLPGEEYGGGLTNWEYGMLCEEMGRSIVSPMVFNCSAPDTGNAEIILEHGTPEQQDEWLIDAHKWFTSGAVGAAVAIAMVVTDPDAAPHARASMILVPTDATGFNLIRPVPVMGHAGGPGHCEIRYEDCRVPKDNLLGGRGEGFKIAQDRL